MPFLYIFTNILPYLCVYLWTEFTEFSAIHTHSKKKQSGVFYLNCFSLFAYNWRHIVFSSQVFVFFFFDFINFFSVHANTGKKGIFSMENIEQKVFHFIWIAYFVCHIYYMLILRKFSRWCIGRLNMPLI